jgi:hypothetical protein
LTGGVDLLGGIRAKEVIDVQAVTELCAVELFHVHAVLRGTTLAKALTHEEIVDFGGPPSG